MVIDVVDNRKFNQDFEVYTSQTLREYLTRLSQNPERSRLRAIVSINTLRNPELWVRAH
jgi:hypothetical protein